MTWTFQNPGWGTVPETLDKVKEFYDTDQLGSARPVPGAAEGLRALEELGYDPVIVTARVLAQEHASTARWLETHFKGESLRQCSGSLSSDLSAICFEKASSNRLYSPPNLKRRQKRTAST